jgi:hypothetical protein
MDSPQPADQAFPSSTTPLEDLQRSYRSLRAMLIWVMLILLIVIGSFCLYLLREVVFVRRQVKELTQVVASYDKNSKPVMQDFLGKLQVFARSNPDFTPILTKYYNPTNPPVATSATNLIQEDDRPARMPPSIPSR